MQKECAELNELKYVQNRDYTTMLTTHVLPPHAYDCTYVMQKSSWCAVYITYADIHMAHTYIQTYSIYTGQYTEDMMYTPYTHIIHVNTSLDRTH